jgi:hypothetical protein
VIFIQSGHNFSAIPVSPWPPSKSDDRSSIQKVPTTVYEKWNPKKSGLYFFGVARKRDLVFIAIGELHVGLAWDIRVILFSKKTSRRSRRSGLASGLNEAERGQFINLQRN